MDAGEHRTIAGKIGVFLAPILAVPVEHLFEHLARRFPLSQIAKRARVVPLDPHHQVVSFVEVVQRTGQRPDEMLTRGNRAPQV